MSDAAVVHHGRSRTDACSVVWDKAQASALGTAPAATFWIALEQNGPWGAQAATQSHLDPDLGETLTRMCQEAGGRFVLIRRPGSHSDLGEGNSQRAYLAGGLAGGPWLLEADLQNPARLVLLARHLATAGGGDRDGAQALLPELSRSPGPVLLICSNSKRDVCCSVRGRPVALESAAVRPGQVWECSHTGGHRFAPTGVILPHGQTFGRLSGASAVAALDAAMLDKVPSQLLGTAHDRGRSFLSPPAQAAESMVRRQIQEPSLLALSTTATPLHDQVSLENLASTATAPSTPSTPSDPNTPSRWQCRVSHVDGRHWDVVVVRAAGGDDLPESCGKASVPRWSWEGTLD